jgi:hypothetical protein
MYTPHSRFDEPKPSHFRHFFDQNALTLWFLGVALLSSIMALPVLI